MGNLNGTNQINFIEGVCNLNDNIDIAWRAIASCCIQRSRTLRTTPMRVLVVEWGGSRGYQDEKKIAKNNDKRWGNLWEMYISCLFISKVGDIGRRRRYTSSWASELKIINQQALFGERYWYQREMEIRFWSVF